LLVENEHAAVRPQSGGYRSRGLAAAGTPQTYGPSSAAIQVEEIDASTRGLSHQNRVPEHVDVSDDLLQGVFLRGLDREVDLGLNCAVSIGDPQTPVCAVDQIHPVAARGERDGDQLGGLQIFRQAGQLDLPDEAAVEIEQRHAGTPLEPGKQQDEAFRVHREIERASEERPSPDLEEE
jgi:hypothetical protein